MTPGRYNLFVFSTALFLFGPFCAMPSQATPQRPWYLIAFDRIARAVNNGPAIDQNYLSRLTKDDSTITLRGLVPSESDLKIIQGVAAATSPGATFADKSRIDANVPDRDAWLAGMTFALRQLAKLEQGWAVFQNSSIAIGGVTKSGDDFAAIQKKLREEAPKNLSLKVAVKPHDAHPFIWVAQLQGGSISISGHVPEQQDQVLCAHAQTLFQNLKVNNGMEVAKGEPREWVAAAKLTLEMLSLLYSGNASISDNVIKLEGIYSSPAMVELLRSYSKRLPASFKLETNIIEPVAKAPSARAEDVNFAAHTAPASLNP
jgi:hypothetical protein